MGRRMTISMIPSRSEKTCARCMERLSVDYFYRDSRRPDGRMGICKECAKSAARANRRKRLDYYREYDRRRGNRQPNEYVRKYRRENATKYAAHNAVNNALRDGKLQKPDKCEACGKSGTVHGHHDDYSKPMEVRWLCAGCHRQWHVENGEARNAS